MSKVFCKYSCQYNHEDESDQIAARRSCEFGGSAGESGENRKTDCSEQKIDEKTGDGAFPSKNIDADQQDQIRKEMGTGLIGIGMEKGARIQVMAVVSAIKTNLWFDILLAAPFVLAVSRGVIRFMMLKQLLSMVCAILLKILAYLHDFGNKVFENISTLND